MPASPTSAPSRATAPSPARAPRRRKRGSETHAALLQVAARSLREKGPERVGVLEIMREAGLTHGGFYAHFASKEALIGEAIDAMFADSRARFDARHGDKAGKAWLDARVDSYVSASHRDDAGNGCPITALGGEMRHLGPEARIAFDAGVENLLARLTRHCGGDAAAAQAMLAQMAGAIMLARAVNDPALSDAILQNGKAALHRQIAALDAAAS